MAHDGDDVLDATGHRKPALQLPHNVAPARLNLPIGQAACTTRDAHAQRTPPCINITATQNDTTHHTARHNVHSTHARNTKEYEEVAAAQHTDSTCTTPAHRRAVCGARAGAQVSRAAVATGRGTRETKATRHTDCRRRVCRRRPRRTRVPRVAQAANRRASKTVPPRHALLSCRSRVRRARKARIPRAAVAAAHISGQAVLACSAHLRRRRRACRARQARIAGAAVGAHGRACSTELARNTHRGSGIWRRGPLRARIPRIARLRTTTTTTATNTTHTSRHAKPTTAVPLHKWYITVRSRCNDAPCN
jgi:hypothetical protein